MDDGLFRPEVLEAKSEERWGRPIGLLPPAWWKITLFLTVICGALLSFLFVVDFSRRETVRGHLKSNLAETKIHVARPGTLDKLMVKLGDRVAAGTVLARIATAVALDEQVNLSSASMEATKEERAALDRRRRAIQQSSTLATQRYATQIKAQENEVAALRENTSLLTSRLQIAQDRLSASVGLQLAGAASKEDARIREDAVLSLKQQVVEAARRAAQVASSVDQTRLEMLMAAEDGKRERASIDQAIAQIDVQLLRARADCGFVVRAPVSGRVAYLRIAEGDYVDASRPLMIIIPDGGRLIAELFVPSRAIAFLEPGQTVWLRYDALPYQKFGPAKGTVLSVSQTSSSSEAQIETGLDEPSYRVLVSLDKQHVIALSREVQLQSGMALSADIVLEDRKLIDWMLSPLAAARQSVRGSQ